MNEQNLKKMKPNAINHCNGDFRKRWSVIFLTLLPIFAYSQIVDMTVEIEEISEELDASRRQEKWMKKNQDKAQELILFQQENQDEISQSFAKLALEAMAKDKFVDFEELYIQTDVLDKGVLDFPQPPKAKIKRPIVLSTRDTVLITFLTYTSDGLPSDQPVITLFDDALKFALEDANNQLDSIDKIKTINIYSTTNGKRDPEKSNHPHGSAIDINSINGKRIFPKYKKKDLQDVAILQHAFNKYSRIRENFGPIFNHKYIRKRNKWHRNWKAGNHTHHIHISLK